MKAPKLLAAGLAVSLTAGSVAAITGAGVAQAASGTISYYCQITDNVVASAVSSYVDRSAAITVSPASVTAGTAQTIKVDIGGDGTTASGPSVLNNGPFPAAAGAFKAIALVSVDGGPLTNIVASTASPAAAGSAAVFPNGWTGSWTNTFAGGAHSVELDGIVYDATSSGPTWGDTGTATDFSDAYSFDAICSGSSTNPNGNLGAGPPTGSTAPSLGTALNALSTSFDVTAAPATATIAKSTGQSDGAQYIARNPYLRTVELTGANFNASDSTGTVEFCDTTGTTCETQASVTNTLSTNASGALTGVITLPATTNLVTGDRAIKLTGFSGSPVLVPVHVLVAPSITLSPTSGNLGTTVTVTGSNWNVGQAGYLYQTAATVLDSTATAIAGAATGTFTAGSTGSFSSTITVNRAATKSIVAGQGGPIAGPPSVLQPVVLANFSITPDTAAPSGTASVSGPIWAGNAANLTISGVTDNVSAASGVTATVTWGDGSAAQTLTAGATTASHTYAAAGNYPVSVALEDESGNESSAISAGSVTVTTPAGSYSRTPSILWTTQAAKITPSGIGADVNTVSINWGDGTSSPSVSKTAATSHIYKTAGIKTIKATFKNTATGNTFVKTIGTVAVYKDTYKPVVGLANPKNATKGSSWTTIKGTVTDKGLGAKSVTVQLIQKRGSKYYYSTGSGWKKATSKSQALAKAKKITDTTVGTKIWAVKAGKPAKGTLYVYYSAVDRAGNKSTVKVKSQTIKS